MRRLRPTASALLAALALGPALVAQAPATRGFELERQNRHADAAAVYLTALATEPADEGSLLGLERVLPRLGRERELPELVRRARAAAPSSAVIRGIELRTLASGGRFDELTGAAEAWIAATPREEQPWREWAIALQDAARFEDARRVLREGRRRLGRPGALAVELAELEQRLGDWGAAAREWAPALAASPGLRANALFQMGEAPVDQRDAVLAAFGGLTAPPASRRVAAELLAAWGRPMDGWRIMEHALDGPPQEVMEALSEFATRAAASPAPDARRARGLALAAYADRAPPALASRARADAARALIDAGDRAAARPLLERLARDGGASVEARALAEGALLELLIADGQLDEAASRLAASGSRLSPADAQDLRRRLARAHVTGGSLDAADSLLGADSSVAALSVRGWAALYRGDLAAADSLFRRAGPFAADRRDATDRTAMLALLQGIREPRAPALGTALRLLARGDSGSAQRALLAAADELSPRSRLGVLYLAGQVAARPGGDAAQAERLFSTVAGADTAGAYAPAAELSWARLLLAQGRTAEAVRRLEHLILAYPGSAFTPEARRELERARGAVPRS